MDDVVEGAPVGTADRGEGPVGGVAEGDEVGDEAVRRVLRVKLRAGLFDRPYGEATTETLIA